MRGLTLSGREQQGADHLRRAMVLELQRRGLTDQRLANALLDEPRHRYLRSVVATVQDDRGRWVPEYLTADRPGWLRAVYSPTAYLDLIVEAGPITVRSPVLSPVVVAAMMLDLAPMDGHVVWQVGAGGGYSAGLLGRLAGDRNVTAVELEPEIAEVARVALDACRHTGVNVLSAFIGDLELPTGRVDRWLSFWRVSCVPQEWMKAMRRGGRMVVPMGRGYAVLTVDDDGGARGWLRPSRPVERLREPGWTAFAPQNDHCADAVGCPVPDEALRDDRFLFWLSVLQPDLEVVHTPHGAVVWCVCGTGTARIWKRVAWETGERSISEAVLSVWQQYRAADECGPFEMHLSVSASGAHTISTAGLRWTLSAQTDADLVLTPEPASRQSLPGSYPREA